MEGLFDVNIPDTEIINRLSKMKFSKIGEGSSAHIFGDNTKSIVLKIFPPLNVGNPQDLEFINKNIFYKYADILTARLQNYRAINWLRQKAKFIIAVSHSSKNIEQIKKSCELSINAYEISIKKGLMKGLPTRVIPNCVSTLSLNINRKLLSYLLKPNKIIIQERFNNDDVVLNVIKSLVKKGDILSSKKLIEGAVNFQVYLWKQGLTNTDMSFNMLDSLLLLSNGEFQIHDVNGINDSIKHSRWYIREKEKDISKIFERINRGEYPQFLYKANNKGIAETARKLYDLLPKGNRDDLVLYFLELSKDILTEKVMIANWNKCA